MASAPTFVLVGHCGPDAFMLRSAVARLVDDAEVHMVNDRAELDTHLADEVVLLVNRELDGRFDTSSGVALIEQLAGRDDAPAMLLISNFADAQEQAVAAGARPGFGKSELYEERTATILRDAAAP